MMVTTNSCQLYPFKCPPYGLTGIRILRNPAERGMLRITATMITAIPKIVRPTVILYRFLSPDG